jgi:PadR family transcriptional regulator
LLHGQANVSPNTLRLLLVLLDRPDTWQHAHELSRGTGLRSGALYPILIRLVDRAWLETRWIEAEGRAARRQAYRLTVEGARAAPSQVARARERLALKPTLGASPV